jgi:hypothetical protein
MLIKADRSKDRTKIQEEMCKVIGVHEVTSGEL